jgi:hypothetical protein
MRFPLGWDAVSYRGAGQPMAMSRMLGPTMLSSPSALGQGFYSGIRAPIPNFGPAAPEFRPHPAPCPRLSPVLHTYVAAPLICHQGVWSYVPPFELTPEFGRLTSLRARDRSPTPTQTQRVCVLGISAAFPTRVGMPSMGWLPGLGFLSVAGEQEVPTLSLTSMSSRVCVYYPSLTSHLHKHLKLSITSTRIRPSAQRATGGI